MSVGYFISNALDGLAATAFTWSSGYTTNRARLNDGVQDEIAAGSSTGQASPQTLTIDFGSATSIAGFALLNHNLATLTATVAVTYADDSGFTVGTGTAKAASTINTDAPYDKDTVLQFPAVTKRYWRLTFAYTGSQIITIGELLAAPIAIGTFLRSPIYGSGESERFVLNRNESRTGNVRSTFVGGPIRTIQLPFADLDTADRNQLMSVWRTTQGGNRNLLYIDLIESTATAATATAQQCLWGKLQDTLGWIEGDYRVFGIDGLVLVGQGREVGS